MPDFWLDEIADMNEQDWAKVFRSAIRANTLVSSPDWKEHTFDSFQYQAESRRIIDENPMMGTILIVGGHKQESYEFACMMGFPKYIHVYHYRDMLKYRRASVYVVGTGAEREDFPAIEGLFLIGGHTVMDMNE